MIADLEKTINLVNSNQGAPNFLLALALCCYTEYWGKFLNGSHYEYDGQEQKSKPKVGYNTK